MYEEFFGLQRRPFSPTPDANCFVPLEAHQGALDALAVSCERGQGIGVLTGEPGLGKTLVGLRLAFELQPTFTTAFLRHSAYATRRALLQAILFELNLPYERKADQELRLELTAALQSMRTEKHGFVLIVDEAHRLSMPLLDELRLLTLLSEGGEPLARLVLIGDRDLEERLADSDLSALNRRICCQVDLGPLTQAESLDYLRTTLNFSGGRAEEIFTDEALMYLTKAADGIPRCLNSLADHALLLAFVAETRPVSADIVREALADLKQLPLQWNDPISGGEIYRGQSTRPQMEDSAVDLWPENERKTSNASPQTDSWNESAFCEPNAAIEIGAELEKARDDVQEVAADKGLAERVTCLKDDWQEIACESPSMQNIVDDVIELTQTLEHTADLHHHHLGQVFASRELEFGSPSQQSFVVEEFVPLEETAEIGQPSDHDLRDELDSHAEPSEADDDDEQLWNLPTRPSFTDDVTEPEFEEEPVVDRYVRIETGGHIDHVIGTSPAGRNRTAVNRTVTVVKTTPLTAMAAEAPDEPREALPLQVQAADSGLNSGIVETYSRSSREVASESKAQPSEAATSSQHPSGHTFADRSQADDLPEEEPNRDWHLPSELLNATLEDDGIEEQIGADVLDLYLDVQQSMLSQRMDYERPTTSLDEPAPEELANLTEPCDATPRTPASDLDETIERTEIPRPTQPGAIQRAYGRLFSELRRRKR